MKSSLFITTLFILILITLPIYSNEKILAQNLLIKAINHIESNHKLADYFAEKSYAYHQNLPEYYYIKNRLIPPLRENNLKKKMLADLILTNLDQAFIVDHYTLLKSVIFTYENLLAYEECIPLYDIILDYRDRNLYDDYLDYIILLFYKKDYPKIIEVIKEAQKNYQHLDLVYHLTKAQLLNQSITDQELTKVIDQLQANHYQDSKIFYLKVLAAENSIIPDLYPEYEKLKMMQKISPTLEKNICFQLLSKNSDLTTDQNQYLLKQWIDDNGLKDFRSNEILKIIPELKDATDDLALQFNNYTGTRTKDINEDGMWEEYFYFKMGQLLEWKIDQNQDGILEKRLDFFDNGKVKNSFQYLGIDSYWQYTFNEMDDSLKQAILWKNNLQQKIISYYQSELFIKNPDNIDRDMFTNYIDNIELPGLHKTYIKYYQGVIQYKQFDFDNNGYYEYKQIFQQGKLIEGLRDTNGDKLYDLKEIYQSEKLKTILSRTDPDFDGYDYKEEITNNGIIKYWDENKDHIYEIAVEQFQESEMNKYDINFDGKYDYLLKKHKNDSYTFYKIQNNQLLPILYQEKKNETVKKGWVVISTKNIEMLKFPQTIELTNYQSYAGIFTYNNQKKMFKNRRIKNKDFDYQIFFINNQIFLFDQSQ
ncbi:MAG: hypothetical protein MJB14_08240 [Spirochaetes bacterium]|nr:hypothetical protein [Spirochaetota bacterium]